MATVNTKVKSVKKFTHEGAPAQRVNAEAMLRRTVSACLLWEKTFYEDGESIADRIKTTISKVAPGVVARIAIEARTKWKLRHVPLLIVREMARSKKHRTLVAHTLAHVIQRPDELSEFLAIYWMDGRSPLSAQVKKGLAAAFNKFDAHQLAKYNRDRDVKLRDVLFLCHAKPKDDVQAEVWKKLVDGTLEAPDTWEVKLSAGEDKKTTWERLIDTNKLGAMALLRNLRNMENVSVHKAKIRKALIGMDATRVLPFRFIAAAKHAMHFEPELEAAMMRCLAGKPKLKGKTLVIVDVSGSMTWEISGKSELNRIDVAAALAMFAREMCEETRVYTFSNTAKEVPARRGFALRDAIMNGPNGGTMLANSMKQIQSREKTADRIIVITDEQVCGYGTCVPSKIDTFGKLNYLLNVGTYENGIGYGKWTSINGFSEATLDYIYETERSISQ